MRAPSPKHSLADLFQIDKLNQGHKNKKNNRIVLI